MNEYIYIRVSTKNQNEDRQLADVEKLGIPEENVYIDKQSGSDFNRENYLKLLDILQEGDVMYVHAIERLGRNYDEIIENWRIITKEKKADIVVLDMPLLDTRTQNSDLTGKFIADLVLQILSYVAQKELENIRIRQAEGIAIAKAKGKFVKKEIDPELFKKLRADVDAGKISVTTAAKDLGVSRVTWYKLIEKN